MVPHTFKVSAEGAEKVRSDPDALAAVIAMSHPITGFRTWLDYWYFRPGGSDAKLLGPNLWAAQEEFVQAVTDHPWAFFLKARQLGETTIECAYDGWVLRFREVNARVHIFSKRDDDAMAFLKEVKFGMENLPSWLQLPVIEDTLHDYVLEAPLGPGEVSDQRRAKAYPADNDTARGFACTHAHVDEWAFMGNPRKVWQSIEPSAHGSCHILTTGQGPQNYTSAYWRKCLAGDARHTPVFIGALKRPDRNEAWLKAKKLSLGDDQTANQEYPMTWEDALSGGGDYVFKSLHVDFAGRDYRGLMDPLPGRKYSKGWDIGRHQDAAVGIVLDVTEDVHDVVGYVRLREQTYPQIQHAIEEMDRRYPGPLGVEKNSAGEAVLENLKIAEHRIAEAKFTTSNSSKARIIQQVNLALQNQLLKWDPTECGQLDSEVRGYQTPDENVVQDSVIALAIAEEYAPSAHSGGKLLGVVRV